MKLHEEQLFLKYLLLYQISSQQHTWLKYLFYLVYLIWSVVFWFVTFGPAAVNSSTDQRMHNNVEYFHYPNIRF